MRGRIGQEINRLVDSVDYSEETIGQMLESMMSERITGRDWKRIRDDCIKLKFVLDGFIEFLTNIGDEKKSKRERELEAFRKWKNDQSTKRMQWLHCLLYRYGCN